jgi:hypothetical protein
VTEATQVDKRLTDVLLDSFPISLQPIKLPVSQQRPEIAPRLFAKHGRIQCAPFLLLFFPFR